MKILHISETVHGGIATYLNELMPVQTYHYGSDNVLLLIPSEQIDCIDESVKLLTFPSKGRSIFTMFSLLKAYFNLMSRWTPDIVHLHSSFAGFIVRLYVLFSFWVDHPKIVYCAHGWSFSMSVARWKIFIYVLVERMLSLVTSKIICISQYEYKLALSHGFSEEKCVTIYNGINSKPPEFKTVPISIDPEKLNCLFVGRYHKAKGFDLLVETFRNLSDGFQLYSAGGARLDNEQVYDIPDNITELGWLQGTELQYMYQIVDVVIVPSRWEGFGFVAIEAMRQGKLVIGSDRGGIPETIVSGENGFLYHFEDGVCQTLKYIKKLNKEKFKEMGSKGRDIFLNKFTIEITHANLDEVYKELIF